jgi:hypothetical protein
VSPLIALDVELAFVLTQMSVRRQLCEHGRFHHLLLIYNMCGGMMLPPSTLPRTREIQSNRSVCILLPAVLAH